MPLYNVSSKIGAAIVADINEIRFSDFKWFTWGKETNDMKRFTSIEILNVINMPIQKISILTLSSFKPKLLTDTIFIFFSEINITTKKGMQYIIELKKWSGKFTKKRTNILLLRWYTIKKKSGTTKTTCSKIKSINEKITFWILE